MNFRFVVISVLLAAIWSLNPAAALGDESPIAERLRALGATVKETAGSVTQVEFRDCSKLGDDEFRAIGQLSHLKELILYGKCHGLTDATLAHLTHLSELETLGTDGMQISDEGLAQIALLKNLKTANFFHTSFGRKGFTGVGFGALKDCPKLERLTVAGISMGDEGFAAIATITQLKELRTWHTYQTQAANVYFAKLPELRSLHIGQRLPHVGAPPSLSDESISTLAKIASLETLELGESRFTAAALSDLKALPHLKKLLIYESEIGPEAVEQLRKTLTGVTIEVKPLTDEQRKKLEMYLK
jgi:hypothetical protein